METCEIPVYHMLSYYIQVFYMSPLPAVFRTLDGTDLFSQPNRSIIIRDWNALKRDFHLPAGHWLWHLARHLHLVTLYFWHFLVMPQQSAVDCALGKHEQCISCFSCPRISHQHPKYDMRPGCEERVNLYIRKRKFIFLGPTGDSPLSKVEQNWCFVPILHFVAHLLFNQDIRYNISGSQKQRALTQKVQNAYINLNVKAPLQ